MGCFIPICNKCDNTSNCEKDFCIKKFKCNKFLDFSLLSDKQKVHIPLFLDDNRIDENAYLFLKEFDKNIESHITNGDNLYIFSNFTGNGKTEWSLRLLRDFIYKVWYKKELSTIALFINVPRFLLELKSNISQKSDYIEHIKEYVLKCDLVVWDDIATKCSTEFESENLLSMINARIDSGKSNIFTSNIIPDNLQEYLGARLSSRIIGTSDLVEFKGKDKRGVR